MRGGSSHPRVAQQVPVGFALLVIIVSLLANNSIQISFLSPLVVSSWRGDEMSVTRYKRAPRNPPHPHPLHTAQRANSVIFNFSPLWSQTIYILYIVVRYDTRRAV